jgi:RNA polymerase sigma factor (sigma-70 family)
LPSNRYRPDLERARCSTFILPTALADGALGVAIKATTNTDRGDLPVRPATSSECVVTEGDAQAQGDAVVAPAILDPDRELVEHAAAGDRSAFDVLLRRHYDRIHRVAWRLTGSRTEAQDIAQEVCCTLVEKIGSFRGQAKFTTWLMGVVVNASRDHHRHRATWSRVRDSLSVLADLARRPDGRDLYQRTWLASGLARLDPLLRDTVVLVAGEDMSHGEAARALGIAESTVSWRMHEARKRLGGRTLMENNDVL